MALDRTAAIEAQLAATSAAHGRYETTELNGVFDTDWQRWYAAYAVEHGIGELIGHPITAEHLAAYFASTNDELEALDPRPAESWAAWTAKRIAAEL